MLMLRLKRLVGLAVAALTICPASRTFADSIDLSNLSVTTNQAAATAYISVDLTPHANTPGSTVAPSGLSVELFMNGAAIDLSSSTIGLDESGFFALPFTLADQQLVSAQPLFGFTGLTPGSYTGDFFLVEVDPNGNPLPLETPAQDFSFAMQSGSPVPEPGSMTLLACGLLGAYMGVLRNRRE